jgi:hypothetical protein
MKSQRKTRTRTERQEGKGKEKKGYMPAAAAPRT